MSGGRLTVQLFAAGELVPALQVLDAVYAGTAEMGHTASFYWAGKMQGGAVLHHGAVRPDPGRACRLDRAWRRPGAVGRALRARSASSRSWPATPSLQMGGWFRQRDRRRSADLKGLKLRSAGLGGEMFQRLGAVDRVAAACRTSTRRCRAARSTASSSWARPAIWRPASTRSRKLLLLADLQQAQRHGASASSALRSLGGAAARPAGGGRARLRAPRTPTPWPRPTGATATRWPRWSTSTASSCAAGRTTWSRRRAPRRRRLLAEFAAKRRHRAADPRLLPAAHAGALEPWSRRSVEAFLEARGGA